MSAAVQLPADPIVTADDVAPVLSALEGGQACVYLREDQVERRAAVLAAAVEQLAAAGVAIIWAGNPLRSPLTVERLFIQAAGPEADLRVERSPAELAAMLEAAPEHDRRRVIVVQQPETLDAAARETLSALMPFVERITPPLSFLLCGGSALKPIARPEPAPAALVPAPAKQSRMRVLPGLVLVAAALLGALAYETWQGGAAPHTSATAADAATNTAAAATDAAPSAAPAPQPAPAAAAAPSLPRLDIAALRLEFDRFLNGQPDRFSSLTTQQRDKLFEEFLDQTRRGSQNGRL